jgi:hypothetical protein
MPATWLEWLGVVSSILTIFWFVLYLVERCKRKNHDTLMVGFLHGIKPMVEGAAERDSVWKRFVDQLNDMLERLQPPKGKS